MKSVILEREDGRIFEFKSMAEASRYLRKSHGYVSYSIAHCAPCYDECGIKYWARLAEECDAES